MNGLQRGHTLCLNPTRYVPRVAVRERFKTRPHALFEPHPLCAASRRA